MSIESDDGSVCVDIFQRDDNTFGFEKFRKDAEDLKGWFPIGEYSSVVFSNKTDAVIAASKKVEWFSAKYKK